MTVPHLGFTSDPKDLIPGEPDEFGPTIDGLNKMGRAMRQAGDGLAKLDTAEHWSGPAADSFRNRFDARPEMWSRYGQVLNDVAGALTPYRDALAEAQQEAARAIEAYKRAQQKTEQAQEAFEAAVEERSRNLWQAGRPMEFPEFVDPAAGEKAQAQKILDDAKAKLSAASDKWHYRIAELRDQLPEEPGWLERRRIDLVDHASLMATQTWEVVDGAASAVAGMVQMVRMVNPYDPYNLKNPKEYVENLGTVAAGLWHAATNPIETGKQMLQWDTWKDSPGRALGNLLPDIVMTAATGGAGAAGAATRGALGVAKNAMEEMIEAGTRTATRHADDIPTPPKWDDISDSGYHEGPLHDWGPGSKQPDTPSISDRLDGDAPSRPTREQWEDHGPEDPLRPTQEEVEHYYGDRGDPPPSREPDPPSQSEPGQPEPHHQPDPPSQPEPPQRPEPISRDELIDRDYRADESDHAAYRDRYGDPDPRLYDDIRQHHPEAAKIPNEELDAINRYMGRDHADMNKALWDQDPGALANQDAAIRNATSGMNRLDDYVGMVERGIDVPKEKIPELLERYQPGGEVRERGFTSTDVVQGSPGNVKFLIESVTGKDVSFLRESTGLHEVAFPPFHRFAVKDVHVDDVTGHVTIRLTDKGR
ncbi:hypothetical protein LWC34_35000 [Kibdelosporangium philippinense]|uniref:Putative T7SS secretion signal domain-containing protein n=1 Tax=Kibdelosporangium philippinense TaxID=211113 RepID=A0ABS8ZLG9_9PSEU|nr:hypothetical protein [Kibdelosporangium philippinense]MCE7007993.1 hypothetical protein [Kibdelosporangium philippinense]